MSRNTIGRLLVGALLSSGLLVGLTASSTHAAWLAWTRQLRTELSDFSRGVSADGLGNVYISGLTAGSLGGPNAGPDDAFVAKYDVGGNLQWIRQLGTDEGDGSTSVSADGLGNVYISGGTAGSLGGPNAGEGDAFVSKYDAAGNLQWTRQLGTSESDESSGVSADGLGNVYISGGTAGSLGGPNAGGTDAFVAKYDAAGNLQWTRQLGIGGVSNGVSADGLGNVYISGQTYYAGVEDAFVSKYDAAGNLHWTRQSETSDIFDIGTGVSADGLGNVYISGYSFIYPLAENLEAFVTKYDAAGNFEWTKQLGTSENDFCFGVSADDLGNVYISGSTGGSLGGPSAGGDDAFVSRYDAAGNFHWTVQLGSTEEESSRGVSADGRGSLYISGITHGSLGGTHAGFGDAFVARYIVPEPSSLFLALCGVLALVRRRVR